MLQEIAKYIENAAIGFTIEGNLRVGELDQSAPEDCVAIIDEGGDADFYLPDRKMPIFNFISRAQNRDTARVNIYKIYNLFHGKAQIQLPVVTVGEQYTINTAHADTPGITDKDEKELPMYTMNIEFDIKDYDT
jgi:hypothetical protein